MEYFYIEVQCKTIPYFFAQHCIMNRSTCLSYVVVYQVHGRIRDNSEMAHHSLQCLAQLATINGSIFNDDQAKSHFLSTFLAALLSFLAE